jgi:HEAT repeat protein
MRAHDSPFRARLVALAERTFLIKWPVESEDTQHFQAVRGFTALGPDGRYAVAELMQIYERNNAAKLKLSALKALHNMGPDASEAIPLFLRTLTNSSPPFFRWLAIDALEHMDVQPEILVPVLIKSLSDSNLQVRFTAVERLGKFGPQARAAVPQLLELRARPPAVNRFNGGWILTDAVIDDALIKIDPAAAAKACIQLTNAISSTP